MDAPLGLSQPNMCKLHADAANYAAGATRREIYNQVLEQAEALFEGQRNWVNGPDHVS